MVGKQQPGSRQDIARARRLWLESEKRSASFPVSSFRNEAWDMFLACYLNHAERKPLTVGEMCKQFGLAQTTLLRRIVELEAAELIERRQHPVDARRTLVAITTKGAQRMKAYLETVEEV